MCTPSSSTAHDAAPRNSCAHLHTAMSTGEATLQSEIYDEPQLLYETPPTLAAITAYTDRTLDVDGWSVHLPLLCPLLPFTRIAAAMATQTCVQNRNRTICRGTEGGYGGGGELHITKWPTPCKP